MSLTTTGARTTQRYAMATTASGGRVRHLGATARDLRQGGKPTVS